MNFHPVDRRGFLLIVEKRFGVMERKKVTVNGDWKKEMRLF